MIYPKTFSIVLGFKQQHLSDNLKKMFNISENVIYNIQHFSINIYNSNEELSDDNIPIEIYSKTNVDDKMFDTNIGNILRDQISYKTFIHALAIENKFKNDSRYNVIKTNAEESDNFYVLDNLKSFEEIDAVILRLKNSYINAHVVYWLNVYENEFEKFNIESIPDEVLQIIKPKISNMKKIGILEESVKIKNFQQFNDSRVWEPKRKAVVPHNMPSTNKQNDYLVTVKEEIAQILKNIYNFSQQNIDTIQNAIWLELKNEWQDILDDSLVNWDTPMVCAQKCLTRMKDFIPLIEES